MCIIIFKPMGLELPSKEILERCWTKNDDGGGFMYPEGGMIKGRKGYMSLAAMMSAMRVIPDIKAIPLVIHMRIKTHGTKTGECSHPFPVTTDERELKNERWVAPVGMAHNGIFSGLESRQDMSDTMVFIKKVAAPNLELFLKEEDSDLISMAIGVNRIIFMYGNGDTMSYGNWTESEGIYYSNDGFKKYEVFSQPYFPRSYSGGEERTCGTCLFCNTDMDSEPCCNCRDFRNPENDLKKWCSRIRVVPATTTRRCAECKFKTLSSQCHPCNVCISHMSRPKWSPQDDVTPKIAGLQVGL